MGAYFLARMYGMPERHEDLCTRAFEENLSAESWKAMHEAVDLDSTVDLQKIRTPQLLLIGDKGRVGKNSEYGAGWKDINRICPNVEVVIMPDTPGIFCVITHPGEVVKAVAAFLKRHSIEA